MGFLNSPEFWGALVVAGLGYLVMLVRTAITQQQALAAERLKDSLMAEVELVLNGYQKQIRLTQHEIRELRELRRKDNLELTKILNALPGGPVCTNLYAFDRHPYESNENDPD